MFRKKPYRLSEDTKTLLHVDITVKTFTIPNGVTTIGEHAFMECRKLEDKLLEDKNYH